MMYGATNADETETRFEKTPECTAEECPTCGWTSPMQKGPARECVEPAEGLRFEDKHGNVKRVTDVFECRGPYKVRVVDEETGEETEYGRHFLNECWASRFHRGEWKVATAAPERESMKALADGGENVPDVSNERYEAARDALAAHKAVASVEIVRSRGQPIYLRGRTNTDSTSPVSEVTSEHLLTQRMAALPGDGHEGLTVSWAFLDVALYNKTHETSAFDHARDEEGADK